MTKKCKKQPFHDVRIWPPVVFMLPKISKSFGFSIFFFMSVQVSLVEQELLTLPEHLSSLPVFSGVCVTRSLILYVCFVDSGLSFCTFSFDHCVVCSSSIYGFWLPLWYLQTLLTLWRLFQKRIACSKLDIYVLL